MRSLEDASGLAGAYRPWLVGTKAGPRDLLSSSIAGSLSHLLLPTPATTPRASLSPLRLSLPRRRSLLRPPPPRTTTRAALVPLPPATVPPGRVRPARASPLTAPSPLSTFTRAPRRLSLLSSLPARLHLARAPLRRRPPCVRAHHPPRRQAPCSASPSPMFGSPPPAAPGQRRLFPPARASPPRRRRLPCSPRAASTSPARSASPAPAPPSRAPCWPILSSLQAQLAQDQAEAHLQAQARCPFPFLFSFLVFIKMCPLRVGPAGQCLRVLAVVLLLPPLRVCFAVPLPKSLPCAPRDRRTSETEP
ncbi:hypothetical protein BRADI_1g38356v3 [Brachypodium distachyon]|uniref:Uncharacterized protein n=1 Tax=Brachypodium distachyon TaxID=15368 RepID=A0A0Q3H5A5_BRADI|nr:hypothetical protein BRADI_1g38356v3 [Brachypodium distachyon]